MNLKEFLEENKWMDTDCPCAIEINTLEHDKKLINKVLSEVYSEVEKKKVDIVGKRLWIKEDGLSKSAVKRGTWKSKNYNKAIDDISTIIESLKVK